MPHKQTKKSPWLVDLLITGLGLSLIWISTHMHVLWHTPLDRRAAVRVVEIAPGLGIRQVSQELSEQGVIGYPRLFALSARMYRQDTHIQAGEYELSPAQSPEEILGALVSGRVRLRKVTIPEGYTTKQIARLVEETGITPAADFLAASQNESLIKKLGLNCVSLEGYLFPDTYYFAKHTPAAEILRAMVAQFGQGFTPQMSAQAGTLGLSLQQAVTLASLIEEEARVDEERPLISAVYHNRLKQNIRLQCDPTVIYALGERFSGGLSRDDLQYDSPYNTYRYEGLPPGPIANPGLRSLQAALNPAPVDYLYFVSRNDGTHEFSTNLKDHNLAVTKYQKSLPRS